MRIPLYYIPKSKFKKFLYIEKTYKCDKQIIPIGCNCHPAWVLQTLHLRNFSLPFDWLNTNSIRGIQYVFENLKDDFKFFLEDLYMNDRKYIVSKKYPYAEFMHEKNLIKSENDKKKFDRRIERFKKIIKGNVVFIYNILSKEINNSSAVDFFINSLHNFQSLFNGKAKIHIYILYDENINENKKFCSQLKNRIDFFKNITIIDYIRYKEIYGVWGNKKYYTQLVKKLRISIKRNIIPKIYFK